MVALNNKRRLSKLKKSWQLYVIILLPLIYILIFNYYPMYGAQIAFRDYIPTKGILGSDWVGLKYFKIFIKSPQFTRLISNTLGISIYGLIAGFPIPIILALALNTISNQRVKRVVQMTTYAPYFISTVVLVSIITQILNPNYGIINVIIKGMGYKPINFMGKAGLFKSIYVWSGIWQGAGYSAVIYLAALAGIDAELHEAAIVDGASRFKRVIYIDLPGILPTATILLILSTGRLMSVGFEKIFLMQNPLNLRTSDVIATYVYKIGLISSQFSYSTAIGLFNSIINLVLLIVVNHFAKKISETSLW